MISIVMITVDRSPKENYLRTTIKNLRRAKVFESSRLCSFHLLIGDKKGLEDIVRLECIGRQVSWADHRLLPCENAGRALRFGSLTGADWILFCEDDIDVCCDFIESVSTWLNQFSSSEYRIYSFGAAYDQVSQCVAMGRSAWAYPIDAFYGTQCFAIRPRDAASLGSYIESNPLIGGIHNPGAYDLMFHDWSRLAYPYYTHFLASAPSFVQHIGRQSICTGKDQTHTFDSWPGRDWSYTSKVVTV